MDMVDAPTRRTHGAAGHRGRAGATAKRGGMAARCRPRVLRSAADVPPPLIDVFLAEMARRLSHTPEARACVGLSLAFVTSDVAVRPARYEVRSGGVVAMGRDIGLPSTFTFQSDAETFDNVLRGRQSALVALLRRHIRFDGSFTRVRTLLCMLPALQCAYAATRSQVIARNRQRYVFAF